MRLLPSRLLSPLGLGLLVAALLAGCGSTSSHGSGSQRTGALSGPHRSGPPLSIIEGDYLVGQNPGTAFARFAALGAQVVRFNLLWSSIAPDPSSRRPPNRFRATDPGSYPARNWGLVDLVDRYAAADGLRLFLTLTGPPPAWAHATGGQGCGSCAQFRPDPAAYGAFVRAVGLRYSGHFIPAGEHTPLPRVSFWSLWNEPNFGPDLAPQSSGSQLIVDQSAPQYRRLLQTGWQGLTGAGHRPGSDTILIGETAPVGVLRPGVDSMTPPRQFLRDLYCLTSQNQPYRGFAAHAEGCPAGGSAAAFRAANPALFDASGWADHPYDYVVSPSVPQGSGPPTQAFADFGRLSGLAGDLDAAQRAYGATPRMLIANTEFGYFTGRATKGGQTIAFATAARWMNEAEYLTWLHPRLSTYSQYLLEDPPNGLTIFPSGLEFPGGAAKPEVLDAYRLALWLPDPQARAHARTTVWGCARPAVRPGASRTVKVEFARPGGPYEVLATVTLDPGADGCYFETRVMLPGAGSLRLGYRDGGRVVHSRVQPVRAA